MMPPFFHQFPPHEVSAKSCPFSGFGTTASTVPPMETAYEVPGCAPQQLLQELKYGGHGEAVVGSRACQGRRARMLPTPSDAMEGLSTTSSPINAEEKGFILPAKPRS